MRSPDNSQTSYQYHRLNGLTEPERRRSRAREFLGNLAWYVIPVLAIAFAGLYITAAVAWHVNPPFVPVQGQSMKPFLETGDLVILHGVNPASLRKGDVIAVAVPKAAQQKYHIPAELVHRIISIAHTPQAGYIFQTKGDNNPGPDVFQTPATNVIGLMTGKITGLGYPILFLRSRQGEIFVGVAALVAIGYFLIGWAQRRQDEDPVIELLEMVLAETSELAASRQVVKYDETSDESSTSDPPKEFNELANPPPPGGKQEVEATENIPTPVDESLDKFASAINASVETASQTNESVRELLEAMKEYAEHLRSHTAAVQGMSQASMDLAVVTSEIRNYLAGLITESSKAVLLTQPSDTSTPQLVPIKISAKEASPATEIVHSPNNFQLVDPMESNNDEKSEISINYGSSRILFSLELDCHRLYKLPHRISRKESGKQNENSYSLSLAHIAWAAITAWRLTWQKPGPGSDPYLYANPKFEIEKASLSSPASHLIELNPGEALSPRLLLNKLDCPPKNAISEQVMWGSTLKIVDWTESGILFAIPDDDQEENLVILNIGAIRNCPVLIIDSSGLEQVVSHPVTMITVSAPIVFGACEVLSFLQMIKHLSE